MRIVTYQRVSTDEQAKEGMSLVTQRERCIAYAKEQKWEVVASIEDDGVSATKVAPQDRPGFSRVLEMAKHDEIDGIVAYAQDRVARVKADWFVLESALSVLKVFLVTVTGSTDTRNEDSLPSDIDAILAAREAKNIRERTMRGKMAFARAGSWQGGPAPFGFARVTDQKRHLLIHDPHEVKVILRAAQLLVEEKRRPADVARILNEEGYRTRGIQGRKDPKEWTGHDIRQVMRREILVGRYVWNSPEGPIDQNEWPPIVTKERFAEIQKALRASAWSPYRDRKVYCLSGILRSPCGRTYSGQFSNERRYYRCRGRDASEKCSCRMLWADVVERLAWEALVEKISDVDALFASVDVTYAPRDAEGAKDAVVRLDDEVERLKASLVAAAVRLAHLPADVIQEATRELEGQLLLAEDRRAMAVRLVNDEEARRRQRAEIEELCARASRGLRALSHEGQRRIYTSEDAGISAVILRSEVPIALEIQVRGMHPSAFEPRSRVVARPLGPNGLEAGGREIARRADLNIALSFDLTAAEEQVTTRICTGCGEEKSFDDFHRHAQGIGGRRPRCKACTKALDPRQNLVVRSV